MLKKPLLLLLLLLALSACRQDEAVPTATPTTAAVVVATATLRPVPTATQVPTTTPSPTPEPLQPVLEVSNQVVGEDGRLTVDQVVAVVPGWLVVAADDAGQPGAILGRSPVSAGPHSDVVVTIDPYRATPLLHVALHLDAGQPGEFEYPGVDEVVTTPAGAVVATFAADIQVLVPALVVADQAMDDSNQVVVALVVAPGPGWVAVHQDVAGEPGPVLGQSPVQAGENENVVVKFPWRSATTQLHAVLYSDAGEPGIFEHLEADVPVVINGVPVRAQFTVQLPPDVFVLNQPVVDNQIVVERVVVNEPAWLVVYTDLNGSVNLIVGQVLLSPGVTEGVLVPLTGRDKTAVMHIMLHEDSGTAGTFEYPAGDQPLRYEGRLQLFSFRTEAGNYVITADQALLDGDAIVVPLVVMDTPAWVVVQAEADGVPGAILGQTWVPAGVNRGVLVTIDPGQVTETLYVTLHMDGGELELFEYPDGPDLPLQRNRTPVRAPFRVLAVPAG